MFTHASRDFGIWRQRHPRRNRYSTTPLQGVVIAMGAGALVAWMIFFFLLKIRGEFFLVETAPLDLQRISLTQEMEKQLLVPMRPASVVVGVFAVSNKSESFQLLFDSGEVFLYPQEKSALVSYLRKRTGAIELSAMLTKVPVPSISRMQIWPEKSVNFSTIRSLMTEFSALGFDDFDVAVSSTGGR